MIPQFVREWIDRELKEKKSVKVDIDIFADKEYKNKKSRHGLSFDSTGYWYGLTGFKISIEDYLKQTLKYTIKPVKVYINGTALDKIEMLYLPPPQTPQEIDISMNTDGESKND